LEWAANDTVTEFDLVLLKGSVRVLEEDVSGVPTKVCVGERNKVRVSVPVWTISLIDDELVRVGRGANVNVSVRDDCSREKDLEDVSPSLLTVTVMEPDLDIVTSGVGTRDGLFVGITVMVSVGELLCMLESVTLVDKALVAVGSDAVGDMDNEPLSVSEKVTDMDEEGDILCVMVSDLEPSVESENVIDAESGNCDTERVEVILRERESDKLNVTDGDNVALFDLERPSCERLNVVDGVMDSD